jgi:hypothetical protein
MNGPVCSKMSLMASSYVIFVTGVWSSTLGIVWLFFLIGILGFLRGTMLRGPVGTMTREASCSPRRARRLELPESIVSSVQQAWRCYLKVDLPRWKVSVQDWVKKWAQVEFEERAKMKGPVCKAWIWEHALFTSSQSILEIRRVKRAFQLLWGLTLSNIVDLGAYAGASN